MFYSSLGRTKLKVSKIAVGTAEIGFSYGIGSRPLPSEEKAISFLKYAADLGINFFDTANYYGFAEERIGKSNILKNPQIIVETKCAQFLEKGEYFSIDKLEEKIRMQVEESLVKLNLKTLPILMLHGPSKEQIEQGYLIEILKKLKKERKILFTGVSTRGEEAPLAAIDSGFFDVIQVAYSILDQRMAKKVFPRARKAGVGIINRSVLLKGALTPLREKLPAELNILKTNADKAQKIADSMNIDLPTLAIRFALSSPFIDTILIGTNKIENLEAAAKAAEIGPLPDDVLLKLYKLGITDSSQVDPAKWPPIS